MVDGYAVGDDTWRSLAASFEPRQLLELLFVVGGYLALAAVLNSIGLRGEFPDDDAHGRTPQADR